MMPIDTQDLRDLHIAVTGASGFLGRHLVRTLLRRGARVTTLVRPESDRIGTAAARLASVPIDFGDAAKIGRTLKRVGATQIIHLAGFANADRSVDSISRSLEINLVAGMHTVLGAMDTVPETRVVVSGSLEAANPWKEPLALGSPYGMSKAMLEVLTGALHQFYEVNVVNARIGMVYGPDDHNSHRLVPSVIAALMTGRSPRTGSGRRLCDWIYVDDVVDALIHASLMPRDWAASMDVGTGKLTAIRDVALMIHHEIGGSVPIEFTDELDRPHEQERSADAETVATLTGWRARIDLADGIARTVRWHRDRRPQ